MKDLELTLRGIINEVSEDPGNYSCWQRLPDGVTLYRPDPDFAGWTTFTLPRFGWVYFVDESTNICYGPVSEGIGDIFLDFLIEVQTEGGLPGI